jgi:hypothetical protein
VRGADGIVPRREPLCHGCTSSGSTDGDGTGFDIFEDRLDDVVDR